MTSPTPAVIGLIRTRWLGWGGADGPFGEPLDVELPVAGTTSTRQPFEHGEILWAAEQGMVVSVFRLRDEVCLNWSAPDVDHEYFRVNCFYDGQAQGLDRNTTISGTDRDLQYWIRLQGLGRYDFHVAAFDDDDHAIHGWTATAGVTSAVDPAPAPPPHPVTGTFRVRWYELGGAAGPLGDPVGPFRQLLVPGSSAAVQDFAHGQMVSHAAQGFDFVLSAHQVGASVEVLWGGADAPYDVFAVDVEKNGERYQTLDLDGSTAPTWARPGRGCGRVRLDLFGKDTYSFVVRPGLGIIGPGGLFPATPAVTVRFDSGDLVLRDQEIPADGSAAQAFATHVPRADAIAAHYVRTRGWAGPTGAATENSAIQLIAHLHEATRDRDAAAPGQLPARILAHVLLRTTWMAPGSQMGTSYDQGILGSRAGDYDMAVKGYVAVLRRYRSFFTDEEIAHLLGLMPTVLAGPFDPDLAWYWFLTEKLPETENHLLMINTSKYLVNRHHFEATGDPQYDNSTNGVTSWLLGYLGNFARFDFLEFNARPYQRHSLHAVLNLYEFGEPALRTAAQIVLDYVMMKFAVSSSRGRRVPPFRRLREKVNKAGADTDDLLDGRVDQVTALFLTYTGLTDTAGRATPWFRDSWVFNGIIAGLCDYRPPPAAYLAALEPVEAAQHWFYHGTRPEMTESEEVAEGGVEIYHATQSFLLSAGGSFLNSGYGGDELTGYEQVAVAQSATLIPRRAEARFGELVRFDPFPGDRDEDGDEQLPRDAVTNGVHEGFACGANMVVPQRWIDLTGARWDGPWLLLDLDGPAVAAADRLGFHLAVHRTPLTSADSERLRVNYDTVCQTFGWLYAMDAAALPFADFVERVRGRNSFPERLEWDAKYTFVTPEDVPRRFTFWNRPEMFKWMPRIYAVDDVPLLPDGFSSLPLVSGPYLTADGHSGRIEIRGPGQPAATDPLVLDYRVVASPVRVDNTASWTEPVADRVAALLSVAGSMAGADPDDFEGPVRVLRSLDPPEAIVNPTYWYTRGVYTRRLIAFLITQGDTGKVGDLTDDAITCGRTAADQGHPVIQVANELDYLAGSVLAPFSVELATHAEQAAVDVLRDHPPTDDD